MCGLMMATVVGLKRGSTVYASFCFMFSHAVNGMVKLLVAYGTGPILIFFIFSKSKCSSM